MRTGDKRKHRTRRGAPNHGHGNRRTFVTLASRNTQEERAPLSNRNGLVADNKRRRRMPSADAQDKRDGGEDLSHRIDLRN